MCPIVLICVGMYILIVTQENNYDLCSMCGYRYLWGKLAEKTYIPSLYHFLLAAILLDVQFVTSLELNLSTALTR